MPIARLSRSFLSSGSRVLAKAVSDSKSGKSKSAFRPSASREGAKPKKSGGMTHLPFSKAVSALGFEKLAPAKAAVAVPELSHVLANALVVRYSDRATLALNKFGYFKKYQHHELFAQPTSLVSQNTNSIYDQFVCKLEHTHTGENRICLEGERGCGKSTLIAQATALALSKLENNVILMHFESPERITEGSSDYFLNAQSGRYHQPMFTKRWIFKFRNANAHILGKLPLLKDVTVQAKRKEVRLKKGTSTLLEYLTHCHDFGRLASTAAFDFFIEELRIHSAKVPVLVSIDNFNTMVDQPITKYRHPDFTPIHVSEFEVGHFILQLAGGHFRFERGGVICATTSTIDSSNKTLSVCLKHREYEPYNNAHDLTIANTLLANEGIKLLPLKHFSKEETRLLLQFYRDAGVLYVKDLPMKAPADSSKVAGSVLPATVTTVEPQQLFDQMVESKYSLSAGNPAYLLRSSAMSF